MRLLLTEGEELKLVSVDDEEAVYAILSHRWLADEEEVTFKDIENGRGQHKQGWQKLLACRRQALRDGYEYVWVDTCCIDKTSSQELAEAINAMFKWYKNAGVCYAYLHDMPDPDLDSGIPKDSQILRQLPGLQDYGIPEVSQVPLCLTQTAIELDVMTPSRHRDKTLSQASQLAWNPDAFKRSSWFTRGWTLQEMIAPSTVLFYNKSWIRIALLADLVDDVAEITGVHRECLRKERAIESYSIAQRMSWASSRVVKRVEDRAYSLLGIMNVNMGVVYGEGENAFQRLQEELLRTSSDDSIFAWKEQGSDGAELVSDTGVPSYERYWEAYRKLGPLLACSPNEFRNSGGVVRLSNRRTEQHQILGKEVDFRTIAADFHPKGGPESSRWRRNLTSHPRPSRLAALHCALEDDPAKVIALTLYPADDGRDGFFVVAGRRRYQILDMSDPFPGQRIRWAEQAFRVIRNVDEETPFKYPGAVLCRAKTEGLSIRPFELHQPDYWIEKTRAVSPHDEGRSIEELATRSDITLAVSLDHLDQVELYVYKQQYRFQVAFKKYTRTIAGRYWQDRVLAEGPRMAFRWYHGRIMIAALSHLDPIFGRRGVYVLTVQCMGILPGLGRLLFVWISHILVLTSRSILAVLVALALFLLPLLCVATPLIVIFELRKHGETNITPEQWRIMLGLSLGIGVPIATLLIIPWAFVVCSWALECRWLPGYAYFPSDPYLDLRIWCRRVGRLMHIL